MATEQDNPEPMIIDDESADDSSSIHGDHKNDPNDPNDPIIAEYDVYITEPSEHEIYVLQFIGRPTDQPFTGSTAPTEMRIKPESGYIEIDIPMNVHQNYDRQKGVKFGEALRKTKDFGQKTYGPAAGFERAMPRSTKRPGAAAAEEGDAEDGTAPVNTMNINDIEEYVSNFEDANEKGHVLNTVTWGGRIIPDEDIKPQYMIGAFRGKQLHLTPLDGIVQLRPELHHVDAVSHLEAAGRRRETTEAKSVLPTIKKAEDQSSADILKKPSSESWEKIRWNDSESEAAYEGFNKRLFLENPETAPVIELESVAEYIERVLPMRVGRKKQDEAIAV